jgi:hypothetical protein
MCPVDVAPLPEAQLIFDRRVPGAFICVGPNVLRVGELLIERARAMPEIVPAFLVEPLALITLSGSPVGSSPARVSIG